MRGAVIGQSRHQYWLVGIGVLALLVGWIWWSYSLVDGNLTLLNQDWFVTWQQRRWQWGQNFSLVTIWYGLLLASSWAAALWLWQQTKLHAQRGLWWFWLGVVVMLSFSYNALSHDIFNYLFNAKMLLVYGANPHVQVALDFAYDPWTRFMHNTHTPAPYGWGWTLWSLWPVWLGQGKFLVSYALMKGWNVFGLVVLVWLVRCWQPQRWVWFAFNPLVLLEVAMNGHNDAWMMAPALAAMLLVAKRDTANWGMANSDMANWDQCLDRYGGGKHIKPVDSVNSIDSTYSVHPMKIKPTIIKLMITIGLSVGLWLFSISIKLASVVIAPLLLWWWMKLIWPIRMWPKLERLMTYWPDLAALAFMVPLLTPRSQQFHPWYFIWVLVFLPGVRWPWWRNIIWGLSFSSMWRYVPWLWVGLQYTPQVLRNMKVITWIGVCWMKVRP